MICSKDFLGVSKVNLKYFNINGLKQCLIAAGKLHFFNGFAGGENDLSCVFLIC